MNITFNIADTAINSVVSTISTIIKNRLIAPNCDLFPFFTDVDEKNTTIDVRLEFNDIPIYIENSLIKFLHLSFEVDYVGVNWSDMSTDIPTYDDSLTYINSGMFSQNISWSNDSLDSNELENPPLINLLTEDLDTELVQSIMEKVLLTLSVTEIQNFKLDVWNKYFINLK